MGLDLADSPQGGSQEFYGAGAVSRTFVEQVIQRWAVALFMAFSRMKLCS